MAKQNVFNFKTMQFELVECDDLLSLIGDLNAECAAQQSVHPTVLCTCLYEVSGDDMSLNPDCPVHGSHSG